jgi:hypothetical protein
MLLGTCCFLQGLLGKDKLLRRVYLTFHLHLKQQRKVFEVTRYSHLTNCMTTSFTRWLPIVGVVVFMALVLYLVRPPQPVATDAPAETFAAGRALRDSRVIAQRPHSTGTPAHKVVQAYIVRRCQEMGLQPVVQDTSVLSAQFGQVMMGRVQNIIARLPGKDRNGKAVLVLAHYDSETHAPGAGDDGAGVAAMLETIRALRAGPPLAHDVIWLFTDGEEAGLLGAQAYVADTVRLHREVGVALNFEGRGNQGPSLTFEVSSQNGWVIREYARAAPTPIASSLFYEAYRHLPNNTDFTPLRNAGVTGLNFAFIGGFSYYHSPADTPAHLDLGSLQHHGDYMLSLVRHFGNISLTQTKGPDYTFFNPIGTWLVCYPAAWNLLLTTLAICLLLVVVALAIRRRLLSLPSLLGGALAWLLGLVLLLVVGWGLLTGIKALYPLYSAFYDANFYNSMAYQVALVALGGAVFATYYSWLSQRLRPDTLIGGALLAVALLLGVLQWQAASSAYLLLWPLLFATLAWAWRLRQPSQAAPSGLVGWLLLLPAVGILGQVLYLLLIIFGLGILVLTAMLLLSLLLGLLLPLLLPAINGRAGGSRAILPGIGLATALVALVVGQITSQPTADQPQQTHLYYALDASRGRAYWLSAATQPDPWTRLVLTHPQYQPLPSLYPKQKIPVLHQAAPVLTLGAPEIRMLADSIVAGHRHLRVLLQPGRTDVSSVFLTIADSTALYSLRVAGHSVSADQLNAGAPPPINFIAPRATGEVIDLELATTGPVRLAVTTRSLGLSAIPGLPALPATYVPKPGYNSFTTQVKRDFIL